MYSFGNMTFKNKTQAKKYFADYIRSHDHILDEDYETFVDLVSMHPRGLNDGEHIEIRVNRDYGIARNSLYKVIGSTVVDNVSYQTCIDGYNNNQSRVLACLRVAINDQIKEFKKTHLRPKLCPLCNKQLTDYHIDHVIHFKHIVDQWLEENNLTYNDLTIVKHGITKVIQDVDLVNDFYDYHQEHAELRYICPHCNLTREKYYTED